MLLNTVIMKSQVSVLGRRLFSMSKHREKILGFGHGLEKKSEHG